jgi:hypothetical protein
MIPNAKSLSFAGSMVDTSLRGNGTDALYSVKRCSEPVDKN